MFPSWFGQRFKPLFSLGEIWSEAQRFVELILRFLAPALCGQNRAQVAMDFRTGRPKTQGGTILSGCLIELALFHQKIA